MAEKLELKKDDACLFVVFGGTGDLAKRKLIPALYSLFKAGELSPDFAIVSISNDKITKEEYRNNLKASLGMYTNYDLDEEIWNRFCEKLFYRTLDFSVNSGNFKELQLFLEDLDKVYHTRGNRLYYLAVAPEYFEMIIRRLKENCMIENVESWQRVLIEKPFGTSLEMAKELNKEILKILPEDKLFRIDHYLGKEMIQNIIVIRLCNLIFESLWSHQYIDNIQITSMEDSGIDDRGKYYEKAGILKDMLQSHILQMLALICMEPPVSLDPESIRDEKVKVLKSLRLFTEDSLENWIVTGQYGNGLQDKEKIPGYREEKNVSSDSITPTYVAIKAYVDNFRWGGVPFYIRAGKRLDKRESEIVIQFKNLPGTEFYKEFAQAVPDVLVIKIQPSEGIYFRINSKKPGNEFLIENIGLDHCQVCKYTHNSPESYERLIQEAIRNNSALFTRWDELECSWTFIESIEKILKNRTFDYPNYSAGSKGPKEADLLIQAEKRSWWE